MNKDKTYRPEVQGPKTPGRPMPGRPMPGRPMPGRPMPGVSSLPGKPARPGLPAGMVNKPEFDKEAAKKAALASMKKNSGK